MTVNWETNDVYEALAVIKAMKIAVPGNKEQSYVLMELPNDKVVKMPLMETILENSDEQAAKL